MNSFIIFCFGTPIERKTEISFTCSYKFPVIDDDNEKKQINIVIAITTLKIISKVCSAYIERKTFVNNLILKSDCFVVTYFLSVVQNILESKECILVFESFCFE